jgi:hypothetical protein
MDLYILWDSVDLCVSKNQDLTQRGAEIHRDQKRLGTRAGRSHSVTRESQI